jgi:CO/xanthine dehydrogenase FAD-binding subunit
MSVTGIETYLRPQTLDEALAALGEGAVAVAGGTNVMLHQKPGVTTLVDLTGLPLAYIRDEDGFAVGANTTLTAMLEHPGLAAHLDGVVAQMLRHVGSPLLRNVATIGGHLARGRISDVIPLFLALDATITVFNGGERSMLLADFYADAVHEEQMLITEVVLPPSGPDTAAGFWKFSRTFFDLALLNCAAWVRRDENGRTVEARLAVGETPAVGARVGPAEEALSGTQLTDEEIATVAAVAATGIPAGNDTRASADYRRALCRSGVARCLEDVRSRFEERA